MELTMKKNDYSNFRKVFIDEILKELQAQLEQKFKSYLSNKEISINAPGKMESRYDTRKYEYGVVADNLALSIKNLQETMKEIQRLKSGPNGNKVQLGHFIEAEVEEERKETLKSFKATYFILPSYFGGEIEKIRIISESSPIGHLMLGKTVGESFYVDLPSQRGTKVSLFLKIIRIY